MHQEENDRTMIETAVQAQTRYTYNNAYLYAIEYQCQQPKLLAFLDLANIEPGHNVLELGCGPAWLGTHAVDQATPGRMGRVDCSAPMLQQAQAFAARNGVSKEVEFYQGDITDLPGIPELQRTQWFAGFDRILVHRVLLMLGSYSHVLKHWARYLGPGGQIIADMWHPSKCVGACSMAVAREPAVKRVTIENKAA